MAFEIRQCCAEEMEEFRRVAATALVMKPSVFEGMRPEWTLCGFENGKLATSFAYWPLTMRFNGNAVPISGVTMVGTLPAYRRRGHLRKIMAEHFKLLHGEGERTVAALWASWAAIYQRYGYGVIASRNIYTVEPRHLQFAPPLQIKGGLREASEDEFELLVDLYRRFREDRTGYIHRGKPMWDYGVLAPAPPGGSLNRIIYEEDSLPQGYLVYHTIFQPGDPVPAHRLSIRDLVWLSAPAYRALWENLATMDLIAEVIWQRAPSDDPLPHLLLEPRWLRATMADSLLVRLVDAGKALGQRRYQEEGVLTFELLDDLCPWNRGRWQLQASPQDSRTIQTRKSPQVTLPVGTLAMLAFGQISATEAARMGRLDVHEADALPVWDRVMKTLYKPACADMF